MPSESPRAERTAQPKATRAPGRRALRHRLRDRRTRIFARLGGKPSGWSRRTQLLLATLAAAIVLGATIAAVQLSRPADVATVPLSQAVSEIHSGKIAAAQVDDQTARVVLTRTPEAGGTKIASRFPSPTPTPSPRTSSRPV